MATVMVTGANRGVGLELCRIYAERGDRVLACCRQPDSAETLNHLAENHDLQVLEVSISDGDSVAALAAVQADTPIDVLINNAGTGGPGFENQSLLAMDYDGWAETFAVNTMAPLRMLQAFLPNLKQSNGGKTATVTSQMGAMALDMTVAYAYCASKAAVNKVMKLASVELAKDGISTCLIHPGWVQTDMGGPQAEITPQESAAGIISVLDGLNVENTGSFWKWNGEVHPW
jgi:NAD(P)-dependent dehydrogenase (short-subunit alcohol dehydrogenase family)